MTYEEQQEVQHQHLEELKIAEKERMVSLEKERIAGLPDPILLKYRARRREQTERLHRM